MNLRIAKRLNLFHYYSKEKVQDLQVQVAVELVAIEQVWQEQVECH